MSQIKVEIGAIPATPAAGFVAVYPKADKKLYIKDDTGLETDISSGGVTPTAATTSFVPFGDIIATDVQTAIEELDTEKAPIAHVGSTGVAEHGVASGVVAGFMSPSDKTKLDAITGTNTGDQDLSGKVDKVGGKGLSTEDYSTLEKAKLAGIATAATANDTDANLRNRATHTGTQLSATISDFNSAADARSAIGIAAHVALADPHAQYALDSDVTAAIAYSVQRGNHTGTQTTATISDYTTATDTRIDTKIATHVALPDPHAQYALDTDLTDKVSRTGDTMDGPLVILGDTLGEGNINFREQSNSPSVPASGVAMFADGMERLAWKSQNGYDTAFDVSSQSNDRVYSLPDSTGLLMVDPMTTIGDTIYRDPSNITVRLPIGSTDKILKVSGGLPSWQVENLTQDFGDGSDGNLTVSGSLVLTQIPYYNILTITTGALLNTAGYPIYCKVLDLSTAPAGSIFRNGNNGATGTTQLGAAAGTALVAAVLGGSAAGSAGAAGTIGAGTASVAASTASPSNGGGGGNSGASGLGSGGAGVVAGAGGAANLNTHLGRFETQFLRGGSLILGGAGGDGGNSGGGDGVNLARGGGGGASGGGVIAIYAAEIITTGSTASNAIQAIGGNGGGTAAPTAGNVGGAGGTGGGGGGYIYVVYVKKTGAAVTSLLNASGGNGGNGGNALGTGVGGNGGQSGAGGYIQTFNVSTLAGVQTIGAASVSGTVAVGNVGGTGANGSSCVFSL